MLTGEDNLDAGQRLEASREKGQRQFALALLFALACHGALFMELRRSASRHVGSLDGSEEAIAVELVTEADLKSLQSVALPPPGQPVAPVPPPQPQVQPQPDAQQQPQPEPKPQAEAKAESPAEAPAEKKSAVPAAPDFPLELPDFSKIVEPPLKAAEKMPSRQPPAKKPAPLARLDPAPKQDSTEFAPAGRGASFSRPPGVTRSGENDEFGRGVIRALRGTMPPPTGVLGYVTVRLFLNEKGDLSEVRVIESSGKSELDQSVVFATRQTYFPLPPNGATVADRTFLIRYVYR